MPAAIPIVAAVIGAGATVIASDTAAGTTRDASNAAITQQQSALQQQATLSAPYRQLGTAAIPTLESLLGIGGPGVGGAGGGPASAVPGGPMTYAGNSPTGVPYGGPLISAGPGTPGSGGGGIAGTVAAATQGRATAGQGMPTTGDPRAPVPGVPGAGRPALSPLDTLRNMPGYQFAKSEGLTATTNAATAAGMGLSGNTLEALDRYSTGLADQTYQQEVGNLENVVGMGQAAAAGQAANIGNAATNVGNIAIGQGNTLAGIYANEAAGITKSIGNAYNTYELNQTLAGLGYGGGGYTPDPTAGIGG